MSKHDSLNDYIARLRKLPETLDHVAPKVAVALKEAITDDIARGQSPSGKTWQKTKKGRVPLRGAAKALTVRAVKRVIVARLTGPEARHDLGAVRGKIKRQILPLQGKPIPDSVAEAFDRVVTKEFKATLGDG